MAIFQSNSDARRLAIDAADKGKQVAAIVVLNECLRLNPADSFGWLVLSDAHSAIGNLSLSAEALRNALGYADESNRWIVEIRLAMLAIKRGRFDEAESWFRRASSAEGARGQRWPLILRSGNLIVLERHAEAEAILKEAVVMEGEVDELDEAYHTLGTALLCQKKYDAAKAAFTRAIELNPMSKETRVAFLALEGFEEALSTAQELREQ